MCDLIKEVWSLPQRLVNSQCVRLLTAIIFQAASLFVKPEPVAPKCILEDCMHGNDKSTGELRGHALSCDKGCEQKRG